MLELNLLSATVLYLLRVKLNPLNDCMVGMISIVLMFMRAGTDATQTTLGKGVSANTQPQRSTYASAMSSALMFSKLA